ncbi:MULTISPECIES: phosphatase PAP2 family protein [unclassified Gordonia (in: high G+C Gram-positive bacteria)]|uniref:phosphatase PAP2 family protein n=1 Tax=unclassified Gordonia (in: high G+C Gram-positive bacteria) TaxID=2657482 RepID=UPI00196244EC|nr:MULTISPECIES: phosphatase PAP2 family protein [unclassified Gordonia (in: high G+C Gram-positive bacteria)]MBN0975042.1 phosphatase PAP2 family protein [Gordonia sp. BP-119]MBN0985173.1 phosphatase PAP2 family protein [Gordonia sp. BP-94]WGJ86693.1 phosphatase PAP2 family protein [Gordonia sp. SMJS1]
MFISPTTIDENILNWVVENRSEPWVSIAEVVTVLGNTVTMLVLTCAVVVTLAVTRHRVDAVFVGAGVLFGYGLMQALKYSFARDRPPVEDRLLNIDTFSFPSGHAMMTMVVFGLFAVAAFRSSPWVRAHRWILVIAPVLSILVGLTRIQLAVHWATDVVAGWLFGAIWVVFCTWILLRYESRRGSGGLVGVQQ